MRWRNGPADGLRRLAEAPEGRCRDKGGRETLIAATLFSSRVRVYSSRMTYELIGLYGL
jgi:hypothetical protein